MPGIEDLKQADQERTSAGAEFDVHRQAAEAAQLRESEASRKRERLYEAAFAGGIVIERVTQPHRLNYMAGYETYGGEDSPVWMALDQGHATELEGRFAPRAGVYIGLSRTDGRDDCRPFDRGQPLEENLTIDFSVPGKTVPVSPGLYMPDGDQNVTQYVGRLDTIEWRLPTPQEIEAFGQPAAHSA